MVMYHTQYEGRKPVDTRPWAICFRYLLERTQYISAGKGNNALFNSTLDIFVIWHKQ